MATGKYEEWQKPENLILIQGWRRDGLSDEQVAKNIGISRSTLHTWIRDHQAISDAYKKGTEVSTYEVENALYKSALGHSVIEEEMTETYDMDGNLIARTKRAHKRYIPPSTSAQIFILKNRRNGFWTNNPIVVDAEEVADDGFLKALTDTAAEDWEDEETDN